MLLTSWARGEGLFSQELPETSDERVLADAWRRRQAQQMACVLALRANEEWFSDRRGFCLNEDLRVLGYYDNHPFADDPQRRPRMLQAACERLREEGIEALANASYPECGESAGYTVAIIFTAPTKEQQTRVQEVLHEEFKKALR